MITTRTPLRITLGGGGSDLVTGQGICLAATIDKYVTVTVTESWDDDYVLHYSQTEQRTSAAAIEHRIFRDVFTALDVPPGIQVSTLSDVPAGTGLGNSGAFTVGLLKALHPEWSPLLLAEMACHFDTGQQDQWSAAFGGLNCYDFSTGTVRPIYADLDDKLVLYYTGMKHDAAAILTGPPKPVETAAKQVKDMVAALQDVHELGAVLTNQWEAKLESSPTEAHQRIDRMIRHGLANGAIGGKLVGAGDGGFILFATNDPERLNDNIKKGVRRLPFRLTHEGSRCV